MAGHVTSTDKAFRDDCKILCQLDLHGKGLWQFECGCTWARDAHMDPIWQNPGEWGALADMSINYPGRMLLTRGKAVRRCEGYARG